MLTEFLAFINAKQLCRPTDRLLVAVSGGLDSVVLTELVHQAGFSFGIAHVNFQLRDEESNRDEAFVRNLATHYQVPLFVQYFDTKVIAKQKKLSTQLTARALRYEWFEHIRQQEQFDFLVTAHHLSDSFETVLLNLTKGTGIAGLRGIPARNGSIIRPLLFARREQLFSFSQEQHLAWVEDSSNATEHYQRNRIRHQVIPVLKTINPNLETTFRATQERLEMTERWLRNSLQPLRDVLEQTGELPFRVLDSLSEPLLAFSELLRPYGFSYDQCKAILEKPPLRAGGHYSSATHRLVRERESWQLALLKTDELTSFSILKDQSVLHTQTLQLTVNPFENKLTSFSTDQSLLLVDTQTLAFPLTLRPWQAGDWFCPLGMKGKRQKVSDFLINQKISILEKEQIWVLESQGSIVWIVGYRGDDRFKITDTTREITQFKVEQTAKKR
ncbi:MAG: tRNA lysidine(34) synthetase TilS [Siphonobacter sp.]